MKLEEIVGEDSGLLKKLADEGITDVDALAERLEDAEKAQELQTKVGASDAQLNSWKEELGIGEEEEEAEQTAEAGGEAKDGEEGKEEDRYRPHQKPSLTPALREALRKRAEAAERRPAFHRAEYYKADRLGLKWRRPRGNQGKMRLAVYYRPKLASAGYGSPAIARHLHPSGFAEKIVHNIAELEGIDPKTTAVRIAHAVGTRKRNRIIEEAEKLQIRVLNG
jgi:large subunit ribosomal protein L32e